MSLPDIEDYIGHKIPVANYNHEDLPEIVKPKPRRRKPQGGRPGGRPGGKKGGKPRSASRRRRRPPKKS